GLKYYSYIPHAFVASWTNDGSPVAEFGVRLERSDAKKSKGGAQMIKRMLRREGGDRLRFLPLHVALEGYLSLHFGGPDMAWSEYSRQAMSAGLDPRCEVLGSATFV
ncbi:MAG: hypothetical protein QF805_28970, partial [Pirellulaceae bacterium]|nr:hypothetical protein [Pirellulaceae bacterium]